MSDGRITWFHEWKELELKANKIIDDENLRYVSNAVQVEIISLVHAAKDYSRIFDCSPDVSHREQMTVIVRFVTITETTSEIREHF